MNIQFSVTRLRKCFDLSGIFRPPFLVVALLALSGTGFAQQKGIITLLPIEARTEGSNCTPYTIDGRSTSTCKLVLKFQTSSLPPTGANFTAAELMLAGQMKAAQTISVYVNDNTRLAFTDLLTTQGQTFMAANPAEWSAPGSLNLKEIFSKPFSLVLQTQTPGAPSTWDDGSKPTGWGPRLVIEYTLPALPEVTQTEGVPATQSPQPFMPTPDANQFTARNVSAISSRTPVSYKGLVYVINQNQLQALPAIGGPPLWSLTLSTEGQHLLLSESGRIYIVGKEKIVVYQLSSTPGNAATEVKTSGTLALSPKSVPNLNPTLAPAVGRDGSLYFVNGQEVYGLNPDLQQLWKVTLAGTASSPVTSPITVAPSGRFVYLLSRGEGLIAINAQTGLRVRITDADNSDTQSKLGKMTAFHVPLVIQYPDGTERIYVAANSAGGGLLANFNNYYATMPQPDDPSTITEGWTALPGQWSQPIADQLSPGTVAQVNTAKKIYAVSVTSRQGTVNAIDWLAGSAQTRTPTFPVGDSPDLLNPGSNGGNVAIDKNGKFLVWNDAETKDTESKLYVFDSGTSGSSFSLTGIKTHSRLLFGSDGTLYAPDPPGDTRNLRAIVPQFNVSSSAAISSPTHLSVYGVVGQNTTLSAPGSVFLGAGGNGFSVKAGSTLKVQQPKQ